MNSVELALVILLSIGFIILLILSIILVSLMIAVMRNVQRISERAEEATSNVAGIAESLSRRLGPIAASGLMGLILKRFTGRGSKNK